MSELPFFGIQFKTIKKMLKLTSNELLQPFLFFITLRPILHNLKYYSCAIGMHVSFGEGSRVFGFKMIKRRGTALARRLVEVALWAKVQFNFHSFSLFCMIPEALPPLLTFYLCSFTLF